jgi:hypothetical protein
MRLRAPDRREAIMEDDPAICVAFIKAGFSIITMTNSIWIVNAKDGQ